ncbi:DotI/IcmL/TraM family protein [Legionella brunensis]|uniref:Macrophage killing protein with similarity to conjugation protein n=1 Tax=Legionella brunensis TaxID=29422 RepID=A0A0W0S436_9GAMM|nr:DotI/IcmL/TraM family protein [Legionella brunensis]KTC77865.1 Macrophage killing protein with similarity to conjugation protein [Legionella brunensis]
MNHTRLLPFIFLISIVLPSAPYADSSHLDVTTWTEETLLSTLSVDYSKTASDFGPIQHRYSMNAWITLRNFFSEQIITIKEQQLTLHPQPLTQPTIVGEGIFSGIQYWRVNQSFSIPELNSILNFSLLVIKGNNPPFMIQSLSLKRDKPNQ